MPRTRKTTAQLIANDGQRELKRLIDLMMENPSNEAIQAVVQQARKYQYLRRLVENGYPRTEDTH